MNSWCCPLPPRCHQRKLRSAPRLTPAHIQSCLGIVGIVASARVKGRDLFVVWHVDEGLCVEHTFGDVLDELGNLFADVAEEGVGQPAPDDHYGVDGDLCKVHCHGGPGAKGVGVNLAWFETKFIFSQDKGGRAQCACPRL